jgi:MoaA/NifB/PqqE/SkfB family radical SAM enzyme
MSTTARRYAIEGRQNLEARRVAHMIEHMGANRAYRVACEREGGDPSGALLAQFRARYQDYRTAWRANPRTAIERGLHESFYRETGFSPLSVDIETAANCDLACPFCFRQSIATPDRLMRPGLFLKVIDQCAELGVPSVKFNWRGEPLLNPKLPEFVEMAKRRGILETIMNTDAVTLTEEKTRALIGAGLDLLIYSFDGGTKATYEKMRPGRFRPNRFEDVYENIRRFARIRAEMNSPFPRTQIQMVLTAETHAEQEAFFALFEDCVDDVSVKAYTERGGSLADLDPETRTEVRTFLDAHAMPADTPYWRDRTGTVFVSTGRLPCEQVFQRLMVTYNGSVSMCCYDWGNEHPVGYLDSQAWEEGLEPYLITIDKASRRAPGFDRMPNLTLPTRHTVPPSRAQTLKEIWDGQALNDVRRHHLEGQVDQVEICGQCPFKETYQWVPVSELKPASSCA